MLCSCNNVPATPRGIQMYILCDGKTAGTKIRLWPSTGSVFFSVASLSCNTNCFPLEQLWCCTAVGCLHAWTNSVDLLPTRIMVLVTANYACVCSYSPHPWGNHRDQGHPYCPPVALVGRCRVSRRGVAAARLVQTPPRRPMDYYHHRWHGDRLPVVAAGMATPAPASTTNTLPAAVALVLAGITNRILCMCVQGVCV